MRIGFYAPLKPPDHPVPSGDRQMARLLVAALRRAGHEVDVLSSFRSYVKSPDLVASADIEVSAEAETARIAAAWDAPEQRPDLLFCYHLYYKAPDLISVRLAGRFGLPYVTAEASHAPKRATGAWAWGHDQVEQAIRRAAVNFCYTANDRAGLAAVVDAQRLVDLPPFIDASGFRPRRAAAGPRSIRLVTVAMMRPGDKLRSYTFLAQALGRLSGFDWHLTVVGDGPAQAAVMDAFAALPAERLQWSGQLSSGQIAELLPDCDVFVWPGFNEAFGISYLEAQACGLPAVAVLGEGTPSVVQHGKTGLLTPADVDAYAAALQMLITDGRLRQRLGEAATAFVHDERSLTGAASRLDAGLIQAISGPAMKAQS